MYAYIRHHRLKVAPETQHLGFSFRSLMGSDLAAICRVYPKEDVYKRQVRLCYQQRPNRRIANLASAFLLLAARKRATRVGNCLLYTSCSNT